MKAVFQTKFGNEGNCFEACIASLLGVPIDTVDFFRGERTWYADLQQWLAPRGLAYVEIDDGSPSPFYRFPLPVLAIAGGPSPRGVEGGHSVIVECKGYDKLVVHDPHPSGDGLVKINTLGFLVWQQSPDLRRCAICGFVADVSIAAEAPTIEWSTAGRARSGLRNDIEDPNRPGGTHNPVGERLHLITTTMKTTPTKRKLKRASRRRVYWAFPAHLASGLECALHPRRFMDGMVRVRLTVQGRART